MGKTKEMTFDEATKAAEGTKAARTAALKAKEAFAKENGLNPKGKGNGDHETHGKAWKKLQKAFTEAKEADEAAQTVAKGLKPKTERVMKYEYPADVTTDADKKKFRTKMRAAAAKEAKGETSEEKAPKKDKKAKKEEAAPVEEKAEKSSKKDKKAKKSKSADEDED